MSTIQTWNLADQIRLGNVDEALDHLERAIRSRKDVLAQQRVAALKVGDVIRINDSVTPKMLAGARCLVLGFDGHAKVNVALVDQISSKWYAGLKTTLPKSLVGGVVSTGVRDEEV